PMVRLLEAAAAHEREAGILAVSVQAGFPWADIAEAGPSVAVTHDDAGTRAEAVAEALCATLWETRHETTDRPLSIAAAMAACREAGPGDRPLVLADASDNPGGGSYGDLPGLLGAMIEARLENAAFALIADPEAVRAGIAAGEGAEITLSLGGKIDPDFVPAIAVTGRVERLTDGRFVCDGPMWKGVAIDMGPTMVLRVGGVQAVVCSNRLQVTDLQ